MKLYPTRICCALTVMCGIVLSIVMFRLFTNDTKANNRAINSFKPTRTKESMVYGPTIPAVSPYRIEAKAKIAPDATISEAVVEIGVENVGLCHPSIKVLAREVINSQEAKVISSLIIPTADLGLFRPLFKVPHGVLIGDIAVSNLPDQSQESELSIVEGTITERSDIPDPEKSDYPDCRFTCHFIGNSIINGKPCPQELSLIVEGFAQKKLLGTKDLKAGDCVMCAILPFNRLPVEQQATQQADDLNLFTLESYYLVDVRKIKEFSDVPGAPSSGICFTDSSNKPYVSIFERHINPPIKDEYRKAQQEAIAQELQNIDDMLRPYTPEKLMELSKAFDEVWKAEKSKDPIDYNRVVRNGKEYVWRNINNSFWELPSNYHLPEPKENPIAQHNVEALIALRDFLEANGCQFLISPVPDSYDIAARVINRRFRSTPDFQTAYVVKQLLENGIETFYPSKALIDDYNRFPWAFFYSDNNHPSDTAQDIITDIVARKLSRFHFPKGKDHHYFSARLAPHAYGNDAKYWFPPKCDIANNSEATAYQCHQVLYNGKPLVSSNQSPILAIGNSFMQTPMRSPESFPTILSSKLSMDVQWYRVSSNGPMTAIIQKMHSSPEILLSNKRIVILAVGTVHLCRGIVFYNLRSMDVQSKLLSSRKLVNTLQVHSNTTLPTDKLYSGLHLPNFVTIPYKEPFLLTDTSLETMSIQNKPIFIIIPTCLDTLHSAKYIINGQELLIQQSFGLFRHLNAFCELPAGTNRLKVEVVGQPGTILSIRNIQVYQ